MKIGESLLPYEHPDPLIYHLTGARIWFETSWGNIWPHLTAYVTAGYFDVIYYLLFFVTSSLLKIQVLGQFLHFYFSLGLGSLFIFWRLEGSIWGILGGICLLTISRDSSIFMYAKNDGALALVSLVVTYLIINRKNLYFIAVLLGLMVGIKISAFFVVLPLSCLLLFDYRQEPLKLLKPFFISLLILAPKLLENYIYTGTIFFPAFIKRFPGNLSPAMIEHYTYAFGSWLTQEGMTKLLADYFLGKIIFLVGIPLFIVNLRSKLHRLNLYYLVAMTVFILFLVFNGGHQPARFFFSSYFLMTFFIFLSLRELDIRKNWFIAAIFLLIICDSKLEMSAKYGFYAVRDFLTLSETEIIKKHVPETEVWQHLEKTDKPQLILTDFESPSFYLPQGYYLHHLYFHLEGDFILTCKDPPNDIKKLSNYRYVLLGIYGLLHQNDCYKYVRENTKLVFSLGHLKLYQLF